MRKFRCNSLFNFTCRGINVINALTIFWLLLYHRKSQGCEKVPPDYVSMPIFYQSQHCCSIFPLIVGYCGFEIFKNFYGFICKSFQVPSFCRVRPLCRICGSEDLVCQSFRYDANCTSRVNH